MLQGAKTYIMLTLQWLLTMAVQANIEGAAEIDLTSVETMVSTAILMFGVIFNYVGRRRLKKEAEDAKMSVKLADGTGTGVDGN